LKEFIIPPHVVGTDQQVIQTTSPEHFDDMLFACMGIYSSADDIATFLTVLMDPSTKGRNGFDRMKFFAVDVTEDEDIAEDNEKPRQRRADHRRRHRKGRRLWDNNYPSKRREKGTARDISS
jgi:hypothetical protein